MALRLLVLLASLAAVVVQSKIINYYFHETNNQSVNQCILSAMEKLMRETCLEFRRLPSQDAIFFIESGHCAWQAGNTTVHLGSGCITDEKCAHIVSRALLSDTNRPYPFATRDLNLKYNCSDKCTVLCENGGSVTEDCTCKCGYGFTGQRCESLAKSSRFTDSSCGEVESEDEGTINLSTYPYGPTGPTFCQWLIKAAQPWETIEIEIEQIDLDNEDITPGKKCNDDFWIFGASQISGQIPCNHEVATFVGRRFRSNGNWLLIELGMNKWSKRPHKGPVINYKIITSQNDSGIRSYPLEQHPNTAISATSSMLTILFVAMSMLVRN